MRIPGLKSLKQSARWLRSRFVGRALILGYHRIAEVSQDPYALCVTPENFAQQLEALRSSAYPISLPELVNGLGDGVLPQRAVVITFDDGYADFSFRAKPLLERLQIPATVFVTTGYIGHEFWWDELERLLLSPPALPERLVLLIDDSTFEWVSSVAQDIASKKGAPGSRQHLLWSLYQRLLPLSSEGREETMAQLRAWSQSAQIDGSQTRTLTADELVEVAAGGLMDIGAHTMTHPVLAELPIAAQRAEIHGSKARLEELLGRPVTSFSYPNGSLSEETPSLVRDSGFSCACASHNDIAWRGSDPFHLPRFWVPNWDGEAFERWLNRWLPSRRH